jgi:hypothetical protein
MAKKSKRPKFVVKAVHDLRTERLLSEFFGIAAPSKASGDRATSAASGRTSRSPNRSRRSRT